MKKIIQTLILLLGVLQYSQDALSVKDGAYDYNNDFILDIHFKTDAKKSSGTATANKTLYASGTASSKEANKLIDASKTFKSSVSVGDLVKNTTNNTYAYVVGEKVGSEYKITSDTSLTLNADIFSSGDEYKIGFGLSDNSKSFSSTVSVGDLVKNTTDNTTAYVIKKLNDTNLDLSEDIIESGDNYEIDTSLEALQFDIQYDGSNFTYNSSYTLDKSRLGGESSDHVAVLNKLNDDKLRILIYSPSNKAIPTGNGKLISLNFTNSVNYGNYSFLLRNVIASTLAKTNLSFLQLNDGTITTKAPKFTWNKNEIEFGNVYKNETKNIKLSLGNDGTKALNISLSKNELTKFALTDWDSKSVPITWPQTISPGAFLEINVTVDSSKNGEFVQSLFLNSDDPVGSGKGEQEFKFKAKIYNTNRIVVESSADAQNKQTSDVKVSINGDEDITSFQFDLTADDPNVKFIASSASLLKSGTDHVISSNVLTDNSGNKLLRVICYSPTNALLTQPVGDIVKFSIRPDKLVNPGLYPIQISNTVLTNKDLTNVSSESSNGSINLITGRFSANNVTGDESKREFVLDLGEVYRNSFNEKTISVYNSGNKKMNISSLTSSDADMSVITSFPLELNPSNSALASEIKFNIIPSTVNKEFTAYLKFTHDGGSEKDSVLVKASLIDRNLLIVKNTNVTKDKVNNVPISLLNSNEIKGIQFDLTVPKETKSFNYSLTADSNNDFNFTGESSGTDPSLVHYVGDEVKFNNNSGGTHPLFIVAELDADNAYDSTKQLAGVTNQGATSGTVTLDLSDVAPGTYYYICGNHKSMQGTITVLPKFSINSTSSTAVTTRTSNFVLTQSIIGARKYRFLLYSNTNSFLTGNSGAILNLPLELNKIDQGSMVIANGSYDILLSGVIISGKENANVSSASTSKGVIVVGGSNDNNPVISPNQTTSLKENPVANTYFYNVKATDADPNSFIDDFKIVSGNDNGTFGIVPETGDLFVVKPENVDYETKKLHSLGVTVSDGTKTSAAGTVTINITDDPNAFVINNFTVNVYRDNAKSGIINGDSDDISSAAPGSDITYEIHSGNDKDLFSLDSSSGKLIFKSAPQFSSPKDSDKDNIYEVSIKAIVTDDTSNNIPVFSSEKTVSIKEDFTDALTITSFLATAASDIDGDGIIDSLDNCPNISNSNQRDHDSNGEGNVCEDSDGDTKLDNLDNCSLIPNPLQEDADFNGTGDVCEDTDNDGVIDSLDNCITVKNPDQADVDDDGIGDVCDDSDSDGIMDSIDNCRTTANADQADLDTDGIGDVCDDDKDGDTILNDIDNCPTTPNTDQADLDTDGIGDVCDDDKDGDTVLNDVDNCPAASNTDQADFDNDGIGDACDDSDSDGILDSIDNCKTTANNDQVDLDSDGIGDVCDEDKDGDTILNDVDNCPAISNTDQADFDNDGIGDVCDDDSDGDGILNDADECPNTPEGSIINLKGCVVFSLPANNNKVQVK